LPLSVRRAIAAAVVLSNVVVILWLWLHDGGVSGVHDAAGLITSLGRITGLLSAYFLLLQILLLARLRRVERLVGFDRLTELHRANGRFCLQLVLAHVVLVTVGYASIDRISIPSEVSNLWTLYSGIPDAVIGTWLLILVVISSVSVARLKLRYELWYAIHLTAYGAVVLAWFHQIPTGNDFILNPGAATYWRALYLATLLLVLLFRFATPVFHAFRYRLRVAEVNAEVPGVVSLRITGRHLDRLKARAGQFFLWRFLTWKMVWESHPFSLSAAPDGQSLRITVKSLGDFTSRIARIKPGTRLLGVGPFGVFTDAIRRREKVALIAGGVGITPIRALIEEMSGDLAVVYRASREEELVFRDELDALSAERGIQVHYVTGSREASGGEYLLSAEHLRDLIPDIRQRDVYICGPAAMTDLVETSAHVAGVPRNQVHTESFAFSPATRGRRRGPPAGVARASILAIFVAGVAAVGARFAWIGTHAAVSIPASAGIPTVKPTSAPSVSRSTPVTGAKATAVPTSRPSPVNYTGPLISTQYGDIQVGVTVAAKKITDVSVSATPADQRSQQLEAGAIPILKSETLQAQSATVNAVSGASETSAAYLQSLQGALSKARLLR
jgi:predicted ferric reductase/uncharacterized protein with FMN-binding domain